MKPVVPCFWPVFLWGGMPIPQPVALEQMIGLSSPLDFGFSGWHWSLWAGLDYSHEKRVSYGKPEGPPAGCSRLKLTLKFGHLWNVG